jgi:hypothetical protein
VLSVFQGSNLAQAHQLSFRSLGEKSTTTALADEGVDLDGQLRSQRLSAANRPKAQTGTQRSARVHVGIETSFRETSA